MTTDRPYQKGRSTQEALEELSTLTHLYDAQALAAFKRLADDGTIYEIQRLSREGKLTGEVLVGQRSGEKNEA